MNDTSVSSALTGLERWRLRAREIFKYFRADWLQCATLLVIGFLVRARGLNGQRIWDDRYLSLENPFIKSPLLILESFRHHLFLDSFSAHYRPVQNISYVVDYFFWNTDPYGFHLTNTLLHSACGALLYFLLRNVFASLWLRKTPVATRDRARKRIRGLSLAAFLIAMLWSVHPVHSAAVDYISGRADSLAFMFAAAGWLLVFRGRAQKGVKAQGLLFGIAAVFGLLALCSREIACIWFAVFLGHLVFVERNITRRARLVAIAVCVLVVGIYAGLRELPASRVQPPAVTAWDGPMRLTLMARSLGDYTRLMFYPGNLHMERSVVDGDSYRSNEGWRRAAGIEYLSLLGLCTLGALVAGCVRRGNGRPLRIFGAAWFLAGYLPISNLIPLNATVAEHWLYLPSVGFLVFLAGCVFDFPFRVRQVSVAFACLAVVGLSARSVVRSSDWADEETFFTRTIKAGGSTMRVAVNLAGVYSSKGDTKGAERVFRRVLQLTPDYPSARNNLAQVLNAEGRKAEAEAMFDSSTKAAVEARKDYPRTWIAALSLAKIKRTKGDLDGAMKVLEAARRDYPETWEVIRAQAELLRSTQRVAEALQLVEDFAAKNWWHYDSFMALGRLYAEEGDVDRATAAWRHASWLDVHDAESLNLIVRVRLSQNRLDEACKAQERAVARQPDEPRQYFSLADILTRMGRAEEARARLAQISQMTTFARSQTAVVNQP